jgi:hypothetical protein
MRKMSVQLLLVLLLILSISTINSIEATNITAQIVASGLGFVSAFVCKLVNMLIGMNFYRIDYHASHIWIN